LPLEIVHKAAVLARIKTKKDRKENPHRGKFNFLEFCLEAKNCIVVVLDVFQSKHPKHFLLYRSLEIIFHLNHNSSESTGSFTAREKRDSKNLMLHQPRGKKGAALKALYYL
jgi:hypothetical protein